MSHPYDWSKVFAPDKKHHYDNAVKGVTDIVKRMQPGDKILVRRYEPRSPGDNIFVVEHQDFGGQCE